MKNIKLSLVDNDYIIQNHTTLHLNDEDGMVLTQFLKDIRDELTIGQTACLEIEGAQGEAITFSVSCSE